MHFLKRHSESCSSSQLDAEALKDIIKRALTEDLGSGDITSNAILSDEQATASIYAKEPGVVSGLFLAERVFEQLDEELAVQSLVAEGEFVEKGQEVMRINGLARSILAGERTALNFVQRMSGIATATAVYRKAIIGYNARVLDTRKTAPGLRGLDKIAVHAGGGCNHRIGLFDAVLIKENHIRAAGGIGTAIERVRANTPPEILIEVETTSLQEVEEALSHSVDIIMLDNMSIDEMAQAVKLIDERAAVEASGGITLENIAEVASTGVDFISIGALTHSVKALDLSLEVHYDTDNYA